MYIVQTHLQRHTVYMEQEHNVASRKTGALQILFNLPFKLKSERPQVSIHTTYIAILNEVAIKIKINY